MFLLRGLSVSFNSFNCTTFDVLNVNIVIIIHNFFFFFTTTGNLNLAEQALPHASQPNEVPPPLRISQRMKLEPSQLEGVEKRIEVEIIY